jgi:hypothetical protein
MKALSGLLAVVVACALVVVLQAADEKGQKVTKEGKLVCGKCTLGETKQCCNVLQVKEGDKTVNYYLKDKGKGEKYHKNVCPPNSSVTAEVTGTVTEKDGKKYIRPSNVEIKKD